MNKNTPTNTEKGQGIISYGKDYEEYWRRLNKKAILDEVPEEHKTLTMGQNLHFLRPNNYSIKTTKLSDFSLVGVEGKVSNGIFPLHITKKGITFTIHKVRNWLKYIVKNYEGCTIEINTKTIIVYLTEKNARFVSRSKDVEKVKKNIEERLVNTLNKFCKKFSIKIDKNWKTHRKEIEVKDDMLNKIPEDMNIHSHLFKKVYDSGVEFFDESSVVNYIENRALENVAPIIARELKDIKQTITPKEDIKEMKEWMKSTTELINGMIMVVKGLVRYEVLKQKPEFEKKLELKKLKDFIKEPEKLNYIG